VLALALIIPLRPPGYPLRVARRTPTSRWPVADPTAPRDIVVPVYRAKMWTQGLTCGFTDPVTFIEYDASSSYRIPRCGIAELVGGFAVLDRSVAWVG
jgi:hypothetical protein